jgi:hypothetical protein
MKSKFLVACLAVSILSSQALIAGEVDESGLQREMML